MNLINLFAFSSTQTLNGQGWMTAPNNPAQAGATKQAFFEVGCTAFSLSSDTSSASSA
jgi:hypothetical protein